MGVRRRHLNAREGEGSFSQQAEDSKKKRKERELYMDPLVLSDTLPITEKLFQVQQQQQQELGLLLEPVTMQMTEGDEDLQL